MSIKEFTIKVQMQERWVPHFLGMLKYMEHLGVVGSSRNVTIYSDGDGDFRPKFEWDIECEASEAAFDRDGNRFYDAG